MALYKFFRVIYDFSGEKPKAISRIKKPFKTSRVFINNDENFRYQAERELSRYFELDKNQKLRTKSKKQQPKTKIKNLSNSPIDFVKLCFLHSTKSNIQENQAWKPCQTSPDEGINGCVFNCSLHTEPLIRLSFEFNGQKSYGKFHQIIFPALKKLNLPKFTKFQNYQPTEPDFTKYNDLYCGNYKNQNGQYCRGSRYMPWLADLEPEQQKAEIYNEVYLREIRAEIGFSKVKNYGLDYEAAAKRYADY